MPVYYLDASAFVKRYRTEKGTEAVDELFSGKVEGEVFVTSQIIGVEMESVAARGLRARLLNRTAYGVMLRSFATDLERVIVFPLSASLVGEAAIQARQYALRAADAVHLATAMRAAKTTSEQVLFVGSDKELIRASGVEGFGILDPEDEGALQRLRNIRES